METILSEEKYKLYLPKDTDEYFDNASNYEHESFCYYVDTDDFGMNQLEIIVKFDEELTIDKIKNKEANVCQDNEDQKIYYHIVNDFYSIHKDNKLNRKLYPKIIIVSGGYIVVEK